MASNDMAEAVRQLMTTKGLSEEQISNTIKDALLAAYKRKFGSNDNAIVQIGEGCSSFNLYSSKTIVDRDQMLEEDIEDFNPLIHIDIVDAKALNPDSEIGDELLIDVDVSSFDRLSVQSAKQTTHQMFREIQKDSLFADFKDKIGEIIIGYFQRERTQTIYVDLGKVEGVLPRKFQSPRDSFVMGDRIKALITDLKKTNSGLQVVLSRSDPDFVKKIVESEVPEIYDRIVEIKKLVREAGYRTKIAVSSTKEDVDPVGACVGLKGVRIQAIIRELEGEKIDILKYDEDPARFIKNALAPADVEDVYILDRKTKSALAIVDDTQLSLAIGKQGLNVRLANRLTDWMIDVKTRKQYEEENPMDSRRAADALFGDSSEASFEGETRIDELSGIAPSLVEVLKNNGIELVDDYLKLDDEKRSTLEGVSPEDLEQLNTLLDDSVSFVDDKPTYDVEYSDDENVEKKKEEDDEEFFECPECGAQITVNMTTCPNCGIGLSFEYEDEE